MKNPKRLKNKRLTDKKIELYCHSVEEVLARIYDRCCTKETKKSKETKEEKQLTCHK
jgi:hypothetical protein